MQKENQENFSKKPSFRGNPLERISLRKDSNSLKGCY
jgi:hypothetical protein